MISLRADETTNEGLHRDSKGLKAEQNEGHLQEQVQNFCVGRSLGRQQFGWKAAGGLTLKPHLCSLYATDR